jgi:hypothetical protein
MWPIAVTWISLVLRLAQSPLPTHVLQISKASRESILSSAAESESYFLPLPEGVFHPCVSSSLFGAFCKKKKCLF